MSKHSDRTFPERASASFRRVFFLFPPRRRPAERTAAPRRPVASVVPPLQNRSAVAAAAAARATATRARRGRSSRRRRGERDLSRHGSARELSSAPAGLSSPLARLIRMSVSTSSRMQLKCDMATATQPSSSAQFATGLSCSLINPVCSRPTKENIDD